LERGTSSEFEKVNIVMPSISKSAGLSKRYTNHSLRSTTVHILDSNHFVGRHITGFKCLLYIIKDLTGHRGSSENINKMKFKNT
jgi:hypothetical protein